MVILRSQNKITDFLKILVWASPFNPLTANHDYCRFESVLLIGLNHCYCK